MDTSSIPTSRDYPRTELVWPGKRTQVERIALPFQVVETVNQSRATREQTPMFAQGDPFRRVDPFLSGSPVDGGTTRRGWTNKLIWGENKEPEHGLRSLEVMGVGQQGS